MAKTGFLQESEGVYSWVRLQSLLFTLCSIGLAVLSAFRAVQFEIFILIVIAAVVPKVVQFFGETYAEKFKVVK